MQFGSTSPFRMDDSVPPFRMENAELRFAWKTLNFDRCFYNCDTHITATDENYL